MDLTPPTPARSRNMAAIKRSDTKPERAVRSALHAQGLRFRKDLRIDLGTVKPRPDIVFTRARVAVFIDGCFWHRCPDHGQPPRQNAAFWAEKLTANAERDRRQNEALSAAGWTVIRVWEHEPVPDAVEAIVRAVRENLGA